MRTVPAVLSIAGSDSGGGAGIQADLKAFARCGVHGMTAITALTAQNTIGVSAVHPVPGEFIVAQVRAVVSDLGVDAVKIGMLGTAETVAAVDEALDLLAPGTPVVIDPVMVAESGAVLLDDRARVALVERLFPRATVITPNVPEARVLAGGTAGAESWRAERRPPLAAATSGEGGAPLVEAAGGEVGARPAEAARVEVRAPLAEAAGVEVRAPAGRARGGAPRAKAAGAHGPPRSAGDEDVEDPAQLARVLHALGPSVVVITGGHREEAEDVVFDGETLARIPGARHPDGAAHGSGCTHSSALAAHLALGLDPLAAARRAKEVASAAVRDGLRELGEGAGPVDVFGLTRRAREIPGGRRRRSG